MQFTTHTASYSLDGDTLRISGTLAPDTVNGLLDYSERHLGKFSGNRLIIDLNELQRADSSGIAAIYYIRKQLLQREIDVEVEGAPDSLKERMKLFTREKPARSGLLRKEGFFEKIGKSTGYVFNEYIKGYVQLAAEITYWSITDIFRKRTFRKGEVVNQAILMGVNASFIVGIMAFIIGLVLALQSAAQLRTFGANIYIVDLTVIAMMSEMGPLITAIMVAGRSGSAIAAEIATMKVTSETDALKTMGLLPVRFVVVPKMLGGLITMPFLTILADITGIIGGMLIAMGYLDISPLVFFNRMAESLMLKDILTGIAKSFVFIYLIVLTGSYYGFRVRKGAAGVGRVTTNAVVVSISLVILADSIIGLLLY